VYDSADPASTPLPSPWSTKLDPFQRLLLLRVVRPDMLTTAIHGFVKGAMGPKFVETPPLDLEVCYADSTAVSPLIFVLSPGSDPMSMLFKFAERLKCQVCGWGWLLERLWFLADGHSFLCVDGDILDDTCSGLRPECISLHSAAIASGLPKGSQQDIFLTKCCLLDDEQ
jgi:hypothetical protein